MFKVSEQMFWVKTSTSGSVLTSDSVLVRCLTGESVSDEGGVSAVGERKSEGGRVAGHDDETKCSGGI